MKLRLFWWERGLKDEFRVMCSLDPLTHKQYADIEPAQNAACACDAHLKSASAAAASRKRGAQPSTATARVNQRRTNLPGLLIILAGQPWTPG